MKEQAQDDLYTRFKKIEGDNKKWMDLKDYKNK
jgi:hypothetical protein